MSEAPFDTDPRGESGGRKIVRHEIASEVGEREPDFLPLPVVTFLMVFLIQQTQNKDTKAIELKLNELVAAVEGASNRLIDVEDLSENELDTLHRHYRQLVAMAKRDIKLTMSHSIEEAEARHREKTRKTNR